MTHSTQEALTLAPFITLASEAGGVILALSVSLKIKSDVAREMARDTRFWDTLWRLGDRLHDLHEFNRFYAAPSDKSHIREWADDRIRGFVEDTHTLIRLSACYDAEMVSSLTYRAENIAAAASDCLAALAAINPHINLSAFPRPPSVA